MENDFSALLDELAALQTSGEEMAKAMTAEASEDDKKIAAAADTDGDGKAEGAGEGAGEGDDKADAKDGDDKDAEYFGKSMKVKLEDGSEVEAFDGTAAIQGLHQRIDSLAEKIEGAVGGEMMAKALGSVGGAVKGLQAILKEQGDMIKSLRAEVATLRTSGAGRRATLSVHEKPDAASAAAAAKPQGMSREEVLTKAMAAFDGGKLTAAQVAIVESRINRGEQLPADILAKIA